MTESHDTLTAYRFVLDQREATRVAAKHGLHDGSDRGAFLHAVLAQLFAKSSDKVELPFDTFAHDDRYASAVDDPRSLFVIAYSPRSPQAIEDAMGPARSSLLRGMDWKELPAITAGRHVGFRVRVCPVVRSKHTREGEPVRRDKKGRVVSREMDAFIHALRVAPPATHLTREGVYCSWLGDHLAREGAATLERASLVEFQHEHASRHVQPKVDNQPRKSVRIDRPDAVIEGVLEVKDARAFRALLARGVGRHRAYGFGMLVIDARAVASAHADE